MQHIMVQLHKRCIFAFLLLISTNIFSTERKSDRIDQYIAALNKIRRHSQNMFQSCQKICPNCKKCNSEKITPKKKESVQILFHKKQKTNNAACKKNLPHIFAGTCHKTIIAKNDNDCDACQKENHLEDLSSQYKKISPRDNCLYVQHKEMKKFGKMHHNNYLKRLSFFYSLSPEWITSDERKFRKDAKLSIHKNLFAQFHSHNQKNNYYVAELNQKKTKRTPSYKRLGNDRKAHTNKQKEHYTATIQQKHIKKAKAPLYKHFSNNEEEKEEDAEEKKEELLVENFFKPKNQKKIRETYFYDNLSIYKDLHPYPWPKKKRRSHQENSHAQKHKHDNIFKRPDKESFQKLPWFTGPLLTPSAHIVAYPHYNFEMYWFFTKNDGLYANDWTTKKISNPLHQINGQLQMQFGLLKWLDLCLIPQIFYNSRQDIGGVWAFGDFPIRCSLQVRPDPLPVRLSIVETLPLGQYRYLQPKLRGLDAGGMGTFATSINIHISKLFLLKHERYLATRFFSGYTYKSPVHVRGVTTYGGDQTTKGKVFPGNSINIVCGMEMQITNYFVFAMDVENSIVFPTKFIGKTILPISNNLLSSTFSLAPAIEYNLNEIIGIIAGIWFSIAGKNSTRFFSWVVAINIYQ